MTPEVLMKRRVNAAFLIMCLTLITQNIASFPSGLLAGFSVFFPLPLDLYYVNFVLPQVLYPVLNAIMVLIAFRVIKVPMRAVAKVSRPKVDLIPWTGLFLGVTVVMNYITLGIVWLFAQVGFTIPDVFAQYNPSDFPQAVCFFIVLAVLPAVCEELLCRAGVAGLLKHFHPWMAVFVSAFAFGLMHATLQQIPFAFVLGIVLGFVYVKTENIFYPILFHFINNAWSCVLTYLTVWAPGVADWVSYGADILFLLFGIGSFLWLWKKKQFTLKEVPHSVEDTAWALKAVAKSPAFWIFTVLYIGMTVLNTLVFWVMENMDGLLEMLEQLR